ncbi:MAG TPA: AbrB/MazE/SpoVT family DNA-binding domain-containing protein [Pseudonocardiaceae bacterium]|nr:AbrB/MazE/SpoVT family DNA-binding domain-containing protein [Pseudonocardiaceae bacterium]
MPTTASDIVAALALPAWRTRVTEPIRPLPLTELHRLPRDTSMLYGIGRVDPSGRVSERHIVHALHWKPGQRLDIALITRGLVIRAADDGPVAISPTQRLVIPLTARRHCDIEASDHVLLAAAPEYGIVIVHTLAVLDDMLVHHHASTNATHHEQS